MRKTEIFNRIPFKGKRRTALVMLGAAGMLLLLLSSPMTGKRAENTDASGTSAAAEAADYCSSTEEKLEDFLENIEGAGRVRVYLAVGSGERIVYAAEEKRVRSESRVEDEEKYVMVGGGSSRSPLIERVEAPEITGAVIVATGCGDPTVTERIYKAAAAALGIPTSKIYVTKGIN